MRRDISKQEAKNICGQIRIRKIPTALFATEIGVKLKPAHRATYSEIAGDNFIGIYNKRVSYQLIQEDWNDTI